MNHQSIYTHSNDRSVMRAAIYSKGCDCPIGRDHYDTEKYDSSKDRTYQLEQQVRKQESKIEKLTNMLNQILNKK